MNHQQSPAAISYYEHIASCWYKLQKDRTLNFYGWMSYHHTNMVKVNEKKKTKPERP
jgi:hypothetical protein